MSSPNHSSVKKFYARFLNTEIDEIADIAREKKKSRRASSILFSLVIFVTIAILIISGLDTVINDASKAEDPNKMIFEYLNDKADPLNEDELTTEEKSLFLSLYECTSSNAFYFDFSESMSDLVEKAKSDDEALLDAVVDGSVFAGVGRLIRY
ncbi:hypothetical protein [Methylophaga thalassica]|nr:hypothetical protein [Methylophaga aminisulfidivorans]